jgi:hypothetical protein
MKWTLILIVAFSAIAGTNARADVVTDWNDILLNAVRTTGTTPPNTYANPPRAAKAMAMTHIAIYDAVNSIDDTHFPYHINLNAPAGASREAAAAQAARDTLAFLYPGQVATFDTALANSLAGIPAGPSRTDGIAIGSQVAASIIALRANDHADDVVSYTSTNAIGKWRPTLPANAPALLPQWPTVTPFAMTSGSQFRPAIGPPALTSAEYAAAVNEVKTLGASTGSTRTADQTAIALFWADGGGTWTPPGHWNSIAQDVAAMQGNTLSENARMFALLNIAEADASIASWDAKFLPANDFWRPITAIREAANDNNPATEADANWLPLIATPPFPSYTSGHSTFSGAASRVLANFFGTDNISFTTPGDALSGQSPRSFTSFSQAANEAADSRLYGGIHYRFDNLDGLIAGQAIGDFVFANELQPIPEPSTWAMVVTGLAAMAIWRRRRRG